MSDFEEALQKSKPSVVQSTLIRYEEWNDKYGCT